RALKACTGGDHVYVFFYGDHVAHLHLHIWARYPGTPEEFWRTRVDEWSGSPKGGKDEVVALSQRLRAFLKENPE
ncbi:MAG: HIT family protein, partial [Ktedonobacteraceae bacterium]